MKPAPAIQYLVRIVNFNGSKHYFWATPHLYDPGDEDDRYTDAAARAVAALYPHWRIAEVVLEAGKPVTRECKEREAIARYD